MHLMCCWLDHQHRHEHRCDDMYGMRSGSVLDGIDCGAILDQHLDAFVSRTEPERYK